MAWNEPGGEKRNPWNRPQQSQNDLDDVLRNLQKRLSALFGRGGPTGGGQSSANFTRGLTTVLILIGAVWIGSGTYSVDAQERAVVLRFGKYVESVGPGYNWHLPWPIERRIIVNVSQQYSVRDESRMPMLTADTNLVEVTSAVQYTQYDPLKYLFSVKDVEETLTQISESAMREAVGQATLDKALAFDPSITERAQAILEKTVKSFDMGIRIISVKLEDVIVPDPVQEAQRDAIKADKDRQRFQQDAETYRNDVVPRARGEAQTKLLGAEAYREQVLAIAQGETSRFDQVLEQYEHAPAVTRERMYLDTMESVYKNARKVIVDTKGSGNMLYLPLDKLLSNMPSPLNAPETGNVTPTRIPEVQVQPAEDPARARGVR
jgi:membrane protease subunit HflK